MIRIRKYSLFHVVLMVEIICFIILYSVGSAGLIALRQACRENSEREQHVQLLHAEVAQLTEHLHSWQHDPFYKEKIAREQLQMARAGDKIYYVS